MKYYMVLEEGLGKETWRRVEHKFRDENSAKEYYNKSIKNLYTSSKYFKPVEVEVKYPIDEKYFEDIKND